MARLHLNLDYCDSSRAKYLRPSPPVEGRELVRKIGNPERGAEDCHLAELRGVGVIGEQYFIGYRGYHVVHGPKKV